MAADNDSQYLSDGDASKSNAWIFTGGRRDHKTTEAMIKRKRALDAFDEQQRRKAAQDDDEWGN